MIQKVSSVDKNNKYTPSFENKNGNQNPNFTGFLDLALKGAVKGIQKCEAEPMLNVTVLDLSTAIIPRSIIETVAASKVTDENGKPVLDEDGKQKRKFNFSAGFEALRRESSGLLINCLLPGFFVIGVAKLLSSPIMGKVSKLAGNWADRQTLQTINSFYAGSGAENYTKTLKNMFLDLKGADGSISDKAFADIYNLHTQEFDELFKNLGEMASSKNLDKDAVKKAIADIIEKTKICENIKFTKNNPESKYFGSPLDSLFKNTVEVLHDAAKCGIESADDFAKHIEKAQKLVKWKSIGGLGIIIPLALSAQPINRWFTHKFSGKKGAPIYNDDEERVLTKEEKSELFKQKVFSISSMLGLSWLSMMKIPTMQMLEFKKFFPSMDQARIVSTATFASRMASSEDSNDLRESTVRDLATFASFYFLGDYAAKGIASFIEWKYKDEGVKLINDLKPLKADANIFDKIVHWTKDTALKSTNELVGSRAENLRSVCQSGNIAFSLLSLGVFIPLINRIQTNKKEQARKAALNNDSNNIALKASSGKKETGATTKGIDRSSTIPIDKTKTAFGAFFNS